jgi:hypothetical protein
MVSRRYINEIHYKCQVPWRMERHFIGFVLHWQEQLAKYEELDLEVTPQRQKLQMLQNAMGDVEALAQVKLMNDHDIARGHPPLTYERYVQVLLSACSTYDSQSL